MDSFELNKVAGAVLGTLLFAFGTGFVAELIYEPKPAGNRGWELPGAAPEHGEKKEEAAKEEPIAVRLAHADAEKGKGGTKACQGCHNFEEGGGTKVGPDLYGVVERQKGSVAGFDYSAGLKEKGGAWTYADLDQFLTKPSAYIKGTKMSYQGISGGQERANVIAYLRTLSKDPKPLPAADKAEEKPAEKAEGDKPAEAKSGENKAGENKAGEAKPAEAKPAEVPPAEKAIQTGNNKQGERDAAKGADKPAEAAPAGVIDNAKPAAPTGPAVVDAPSQPDPAAEEKAKAVQSGQQGQDKPAEETKPAEADKAQGTGTDGTKADGGDGDKPAQ